MIVERMLSKDTRYAPNTESGCRMYVSLGKTANKSSFPGAKLRSVPTAINISIPPTASQALISFSLFRLEPFGGCL